MQDESKWNEEELESDLRYVVSQLVINAHPERIFQILTDYAQVTSKFPNMTKLKVLSDDGVVKKMAQQVKPLPPVPPISYVVEVKETYPTRLQWRGCTAFIKTNQGCFTLQATNEGRETLVTFAAWAEAALIVPRSIIRFQMKILMPRVLQTLKHLAEQNSDR